MERVDLPANINQIGSIGDGLRIYIEDNVYSYLNQCAEAGGDQERIALLAGQFTVVDGQQILFISGAIQAKYTETRNGLTVFTDESMAYGQECLHRYYGDMKIVGWMQSQPGYGSHINAASKEVHRNLFPKKYQLLFVMDPQEKTNAFYVYSHNGSNLNETKGYFIYYESNEQMRDYAAENPVTEKVEIARPSHEKPVTVAALSLAEESAAGAVPAHTVNRAVQRDVQDQKRVVNLLVALSAVMFIVSFIMGAGLIQNQDRISALENDIRQLSTSYRDIVSVFAQRPVNDPVNNSETKAEQPDSQSAEIIDVDGNELQSQNTETAQEPQATIQPDPIAPETSVPAANVADLPATEEPVPSQYIIQVGDSLNSISRKFYGSTSKVNQIMTLNNIQNPNLIVTGSSIQLPPK